jgi:uncharacterized protein (TIGR00369 family)
MTSSGRTRTVTWNDPAETLEATVGLSGLDALRAMVRGEIPPPPIALLLDFAIVEADEGRVVFEGVPAEFHYNPIGVVHGGFAMTLLDSALGCAVLSTLPAGARYTTTDTQARFIRPITKDTGRVRCVAKTLHVGRTTGIAEAHLTDMAGKLLAVGTTACAVFR